MYCQHCGNSLADERVTETETEVAETYVPAEVEIARINAERDIKLAQINARVTENVIEVEQAVELAAAEAKADALESVLEPDPPEAADAPVVVVQAPDGDEPMGDVPVDLPPAEGDSGSHGEPKRSSAYGSSGWFA